jgi:hypothetical protein
MKTLLIGLTLLASMSSFAERTWPSLGEMMAVPMPNEPSFFMKFYKVDISNDKAEKLFNDGEVTGAERSFLTHQPGSDNISVVYFENFEISENKNGIICTKRIGKLEYSVKKVSEKYEIPSYVNIEKRVNSIYNDHDYSPFRCYIEK